MHISSEIERTVENFTMDSYAYLRSLCISRLTLYNGRRGEEGARLTNKEYAEAKEGLWLPAKIVEQVDDPAEKHFVGNYMLAYMRGKGPKYVPLLIPRDLIPALNIISKHRTDFGITKTNIFLFASKNSESHSSGWHAVHEVSSGASLSRPITATQNRHWLSSVYASLDMPETTRKIYLDQISHSWKIDTENYLMPQGLRHVGAILPILETAAEGKYINFIFWLFSYLNCKL